MTSTSASPDSTVHSTARDGAVHIRDKFGGEMAQNIVDVGAWPEPAIGSYYNRPWRGYVEVHGFQYGEYDQQWIRVARITSVEDGQAYVALEVFDASYRIVDVGGNIYEQGVASGSPAS